MEYTLDDKYRLIKEEILKNNSKNPIEIVKSIMHKDYINIHGPEHHFLDGTSFLIAYKNAGGEIDVNEAIDELAKRTIKMPGAMCGLWGVCGSVTSVGAALSIIFGTGPLTSNEHYKNNMEFTSTIIEKMSNIGGPRCCKRNAFLLLTYAKEFVENKYGVKMEIDNFKCEFSSYNKQCIGIKCPYFEGVK